MDERDYKAMNKEKPKVKKSEMLEMIKELESKVDDLQISISDLQIKSFSALDKQARTTLSGQESIPNLKEIFSTTKQPQYEIGENYVFTDNVVHFDKSHFIVRQLLNVDLTKEYPFQDHLGANWKFARRIKYTLK